MDALFTEQKDVPAGTDSAEPDPKIKSRPYPMATRRADALIRMAERCLSGNFSGKSCSGSERLVINVHTDLETLQITGCGAQSELEDAPNISSETS